MSALAMTIGTVTLSACASASLMCSSWAWRPHNTRSGRAEMPFRRPYTQAVAQQLRSWRCADRSSERVYRKPRETYYECVICKLYNHEELELL
eukprot:720401-Pleurochrysis_carterae.AAC.6